MTYILFLIASLSCGMASGFAATNYVVITQEEDHGIGSLVILIPPTDFRKDTLVSLSMGFLKRYSQFSIMDIGIYTNRTSMYDFRGTGVFDSSYSNWLQEFEATMKRPLPCGAEFLKIGTAAALRIRYPDERIEEVALQDGSAFHQEFGEVQLHVLHIAIVRQGWGSQAGLTPLLYFSASGEISPKQGGTIARRILKDSGATRLKINLRPDKWFILDPYYPLVNPFAPVNTPPTEEAKRAWQLLCEPTEDQGCHQVYGKP